MGRRMAWFDSVPGKRGGEIDAARVRKSRPFARLARLAFARMASAVVALLVVAPVTSAVPLVLSGAFAAPAMLFIAVGIDTTVRVNLADGT